MNTVSIIIADMPPWFSNGWVYYPFLIICISYVLLFFAVLLHTTFNKKVYDIAESVGRLTVFHMILVTIMAFASGFLPTKIERASQHSGPLGPLLVAIFLLIWPFFLVIANVFVAILGYTLGLIGRLCFCLFLSFLKKIKSIEESRKLF